MRLCLQSQLTAGKTLALLPQAPAFDQSFYFHMQSHDYLPKCWSKAVNRRNRQGLRVQNMRNHRGKRRQRVKGEVYGSQCLWSAIIEASGQGYAHMSVRLMTYLPVGGAIIAVVGQEVVVQLPENMEGNSSIRCRHIVVGFTEHGIKAV